MGASNRSPATDGPIWPRRAAFALALYALTGGAVSLAGWAFDVQRLTDWRGDDISIQGNTAALMVLAGAALVVLQAGHRRVGILLGAFVAVVGALTVLQYVVGADFRFNHQLLFGRQWGRGATVSPGRMGLPASSSFTLIGMALVLLGRVGPAAIAARRFVPALGLGVCVLMMLSLVGYLFGAGSFFAIPWLSAIALQTSTLLLALGAALVLSLREHEPMRLLLSDSDAGFMARRVLPTLVLLPPLLGWLRDRGQASGLYDAGTGSALLVLGVVLVSVGLMWWALGALRVREQREAASGRRVAGMLGSITDGFFCLDAEWRFSFVNDVIAQRFGTTRERILGRRVWEMFPEAIGNEAYLQLNRAMADRAGAEYEVFYQPWQCWLREKAYPTDDGGLAVYSQDITVRKYAKEAIRRNQATLFELVERAPFGVYIVDAGFRITQMNRGSQDGAFVNIRPVIGRDFAEVVRILWPEDVAAYVIANFRRTLDTGEPFRSKNYVHPRADIEVVEAYEWELHRIALPDGADGVVCYYYDSTRLRQAEQALRVSQERMQLAITAGQAGTWDLDLVTKRSVWSESHFTMLGYRPTADREATVEQWKTAVLPEDRPGMMEEWERAEAGHDLFRSEHRLRRVDDGSVIWVRAAGRFFFDDSGRAVRFVGVFFDISEEKHAIEALRLADRAKDEFLATLAHELRNPLAPVRNAVRVLQQRGPLTPELKWACDVIDRQIQQMTRLVDDLLDVSRISRDRIELRRERVDLATVVHGAVEASRPLIDAGEHELVLDLPADPVYLDADVTRLAQVVCNLLNNAAKFSDRGGRIVVNARQEGSDAVLSVRDTGMGIPADMLSRVFDMFTQVDSTLEKSHGGLGIGLTLAKRLVELHGGRIEARSNGPGTGSEFVVWLPVPVPVDRALAQQPAATAPSAASAPSHRIVIVDDNRDAADSLALMLRVMGHDTRPAYDGLQGLGLAEEFHPYVALLDLGLPRMNGYDMARTIRKTSWGANAVLVAVTGWGQEHDRRRSREAGFDHHLVKPVSPEQLFELLGSLPARTERPAALPVEPARATQDPH